MDRRAHESTQNFSRAWSCASRRFFCFLRLLPEPEMWSEGVRETLPSGLSIARLSREISLTDVLSFMENVYTRRQFYVYLNLLGVFKNFVKGKFTYIWHLNRNLKVSKKHKLIPIWIVTFFMPSPSSLLSFILFKALSECWNHLRKR